MHVNYKKVAMLGLARTQAGRLLGYVPFSRLLYKKVILSRRKYPALFYGVYDSYEAAWDDISKSRLRGWNHPEAASIWVKRVDPVRPSTYPVFFWLMQLLTGRVNGTRLRRQHRLDLLWLSPTYALFLSVHNGSWSNFLSLSLKASALRLNRMRPISDSRRI